MTTWRASRPRTIFQNSGGEPRRNREGPAHGRGPDHLTEFVQLFDHQVRERILRRIAYVNRAVPQEDGPGFGSAVVRVHGHDNPSEVYLALVTPGRVLGEAEMHKPSEQSAGRGAHGSADCHSGQHAAGQYGPDAWNK